ncbi:TrmH family RNA methyltransferase [Gracilimonas sp.]|uniref:TrmH family RNA methyltransferase n=1 Tax=Gracilimonas sp. TaxID=1974203 RepID=UPI0028728654|nr:RNA methyltransferase [Gracilimonas sp.]
MNHSERKDLVNYLKEFATEARWDKFVEVAKQRTRYISVVVEDIYQSHNASAVLRSCDGFGIQDVHIIENQNNFDASSQVTIGADQWLTLHRYNEPGMDNTEACFSKLKKEGYRIIATTPHENDTNLNDLDLNQKTALVFGSEIDGISERAKELADGFLKIPMAGFSESFNISVSAAICLYNITRRLRASSIDWMLTTEEIDHLTYNWLKKSIKAGDQLERNFLKQKN